MQHQNASTTPRLQRQQAHMRAERRGSGPLLPRAARALAAGFPLAAHVRLARLRVCARLYRAHLLAAGTAARLLSSPVSMLIDSMSGLSIMTSTEDNSRGRAGADQCRAGLQQSGKSACMAHGPRRWRRQVVASAPCCASHAGSPPEELGVQVGLAQQLVQLLEARTI